MQVCHFQHLLRQIDKNEPSRFLGDGVSFRAKLIGVLEVAEARGDRMCQEALADLKMAVRAAGEHKQRIQVHVAIDGLRLRDDKTGDSLYHHPVHKISFIAQDMTDSRAFGYIFGSPDTGHRFFGIKTDKAASQVVIAMRDLFQVVFELKKKEIELAKQQLEGKIVSSSTRHPTCLTSEPAKIKSVSQVTEVSTKAPETGASGGRTEDGVAELVDLEQELCSLRRGLTQVEGLTPQSAQADPFGDSFTAPQSAGDVKKGLLPPPPVGTTTRSRSTTAATSTPRSAHNFSPSRTSNTSALGFDLTTVTSQASLDVTSSAPASFTEKMTETVPIQNSTTNISSSLAFDVFTELDPLGTGRSKPYVDKKHFFQELKNPPKKVLKDLVTTTSSISLLTDILPCVTTSMETVITETTYSAQTITSVGRHSGGSVSIVNPPPAAQMFTGSLFTSDPFAETDPFDSTDPFTDCFKEDPFGANMNDFSVANFNRMEEFRSKLSREMNQEVKEDERPPPYGESGKNIFNGPLQVSLPPETVPKSPRLQRQMTADARQSSIRQRPQSSAKLSAEGASPPPPLPPKKVSDLAGGKPPPRPPHSDVELVDSGAESGPALPRPARRREPCPDRSIKPRLSSVTTNSSEDEYLSPVPPPLPKGMRHRPQPRAAPAPSGGTGGSGLDMTLSQLLTCGLDELAVRLSVPASRLATMTLAQLTAYLKEYLSAKNQSTEEPKPPELKTISEPIKENKNKFEFKTNFEDSFTGISGSNCTFVANFEDFDKKVEPSFDRYAVFREIQEEELKEKSLLDPLDKGEQEEEGSDTKDEDEVHNLDELIMQNAQRNLLNKENHSPMKALDELTIDSLSALYGTSISPRPSEIDCKIEDIKSVMKTLSIEQPNRSVTPKENAIDSKQGQKSQNDRYAALREISIIEPQDEFESIPPEAPKERKKSDEKSDGFDNSDFFDCIDNSSLSFSHVDDAFRKSPSIKSPAPDKETTKETPKVEDKKLKIEEKNVCIPPVIGQSLPLARLSAGSLSDVVSGSSPEAVHKDKLPSLKHTQDASGGPAWTVFPPRSPHSEEGASPWSSDSKDSEVGGSKAKWEGSKREQSHSPPAIPRPRRKPQGKSWHARQTSSSSRDVSPWDEDPPPISRSHHRSSAHSRDSRHNSAGSRECLDSGSGRDKDKLRDKRDPLRDRDRELSRDRRDSGSTRDRRDSGSGRDRRDISKDRDRERDPRREKRSRERDKEWEREYGRDYRESKSRERKDREREIDRDRHRRPHHSWNDEEDYSDGEVSGRSSPTNERWPDHRNWRRDDRNYGSLSWRDSRRRADSRQSDDTADRDRRYGATLGSRGRRSAGPRPREPESRRRNPRREPPREEPRHRATRSDRFRFSNDFSEHDSPRDQSSPFENDFVETPSSVGPRKKGTYSSLEGTRFAFDRDEEPTASPASAGSRIRDPESPATRFRFDSDSVSPRSLFEDDFASETRPTPSRAAATSIAEEDESCTTEVIQREAETNGGRSRNRPKPRSYAHQDIKKSESVNIFVRETDPFDGDDFFACTGSDRAARRENWPGDFQAFDDV